MDTRSIIGHHRWNERNLASFDCSLSTFINRFQTKRFVICTPKSIVTRDAIVMTRNCTASTWLQVFLRFILFQYAACGCLLPELVLRNGAVVLPAEMNENQTIAEELSVMQFICSDDYLLIGSEYIQCDDEKWTDDVPFCANMKCPDPPLIENATYITTSDLLMIGSVTEYSCNDSHEFQNTNASTLRCCFDEESKTAEWEGEIPVCKEKSSCPDPGVSVHGRRTGECCSSGVTLHFSCIDGYELVGEGEMVCLQSGIWSSGRPLCRPSGDVCEFPPPIPHGLVIGVKEGDYFIPLEKAQLRCEPGYTCKGNKYISCLTGGRWNKEFGKCEEIFCNPPETVAHGTIPELQTTNLTIFPYNFGITYVCNEGYSLYGGDIWKACGRRGWTGEMPYCEVTRCPDPGIPDHGMKSGGVYTVGSSVRFSCFPGYELLGSVERYCMPNGQWTGETARCNIPANYCPDPGTPLQGSKNMTEYKMGDKVRFECPQLFILSGSEVRECLPDHTWSGTEASCIGRYDFDNRAQVRDMLRVTLAEKAERQREELRKYEEAWHSRYGNGSFVMSKVLNLNFPGRIILYFAFDVSGSIGLQNFAKSIDFAKAVVRKVGITEKGARAGALTFSSKVEEKFLPMNFDSTKGVLEALDEIQYTGGGTAATSALKSIRTNFIPLVRRWLGITSIKSVIFVLTDGKANMAGDPKDEADMLKKEGVEIFGIGITGELRKKVLYDIASSSKYGNKEDVPNVFILQNYGTLAWLVQEITNGTVDYSQCGLGLETLGVQRSRMFGGKKTTDPWPWMAALFMTMGNEIPPRQTLECGGSIISRHFILTAAHCMFNVVYQKRAESQIRVKLGLTRLDDTKHLQEFEVRKMYIHPRYRPKNTHDYDIALLELKKPIQYNAFVRPICLPPQELPEDSPFYKPTALSWTAGWGHAGTIKKSTKLWTVVPEVSPFLKEICLPIQTAERCRESIKDDHLNETEFTDRMFCAGDGKGKKDTCRGDSGGPVMQSKLNEEGYFSWTQIGIVSWGQGCGEKNEYSFYTHLQRLRSWVDDTIAAATRRRLD